MDLQNSPGSSKTVQKRGVTGRAISNSSLKPRIGSSPMLQLVLARHKLEAAISIMKRFGGDKIAKTNT
jgi:hypothetical protein